MWAGCCNEKDGFCGGWVCRQGRRGVAATALWATAELENWTQSVTKVGWTSFEMDSPQIHKTTLFFLDTTIQIQTLMKVMQKKIENYIQIQKSC